MVLRIAWHASGTFDKADGSGGSNGATMRFEPESADDANAGLSIIRDMLLPVKQRHPEISYADLWTFAGCRAVEFLGGPRVKHSFCRSDAPNGSYCPPVGRLPDAAQGAEHLRDVFYRMGFNDQEIVCLSGAHTLGRCHRTRSGYDGPWTRNPLKFDNQYFKVLLHLDWQPKKWDGPLQFEDVETGELMMLPTDMALKTDPEFRKYAEMYAKDEELFFRDFAAALDKLFSLGTKQCPHQERSPKQVAGAALREAAMHGSVDVVRKLVSGADINEIEISSGRTALHKAAFWGHHQTIEFLLGEGANVDAQDYNGDTPLHDATRFGHAAVVKLLLKAKASAKIINKEGQTPADVAAAYEKPELVELLKSELHSL
jgi:catalase (peroxidase I)